MIISQHDAWHLAQRARAKSDLAAKRLSDMIVAACIEEIERGNANILRTHRTCVIKACRRAHHCTGSRPICLLFQRRRVLNAEQQQAMLDEMYWRVLEALVASEAA
ncbi:hypothetical protein AB7714_26355 [Tardiphaga sp. 1201_B9_N1_1]|jgi:hypothetical protein|uniref:hypothetical protein n=1 Tax=Tardiphaga sp. 1201_B9_N1_1 TaxID=3240377 RepID=UPI003F295D6A